MINYIFLSLVEIIKNFNTEKATVGEEQSSTASKATTCGITIPCAQGLRQAAAFLTQLPATVLTKAVEDGPFAWVIAPTWKTWKKVFASWLQIQIQQRLKSFGECAIRWQTYL